MLNYKFLTLLLIAVKLFATSTETIHSSLSTYYEFKNYENSKQKKSGTSFGIGADVHHLNATYKIAYESAQAETYQPPLQEDLEVQKLFFQYGYKFTKKLYIHLNYINVLSDNIAITNHGESYAGGFTYRLSKEFSLGSTYYYTTYKFFDVKQSDLVFNYHFKSAEMQFRFTSITKYLALEDKEPNSFTKNAQSSYITSGLKLHAALQSYHLGVGAYFGKRAFAIMDNGFKVQHHAMEFDRTYAIGIGKNIKTFVLRLQYIYQRATELPIENKNVTMGVTRFMLNYKF